MNNVEGDVPDFIFSGNKVQKNSCIVKGIVTRKHRKRKGDTAVEVVAVVFGGVFGVIIKFGRIE